MKYLIYTFFLIFISIQLNFAQKLSKTKVNDEITVEMPSDFEPMSENIYVRKYGAYREPIGIYTDPYNEVGFGINEVQNRSLKAFAQSEFSEKDLEMLKGMYKGSIAAMHTKVTFIQDKIVEINKRKYILFEFLSTVKDEDKVIGRGGAVSQYNHILYTVKEGRLLVFNFNCDARFKRKWQATAKSIMGTIKIK